MRLLKHLIKISNLVVRGFENLHNLGDDLLHLGCGFGGFLRNPPDGYRPAGWNPPLNHDSNAPVMTTLSARPSALGSGMPCGPSCFLTRWLANYRGYLMSAAQRFVQDCRPHKTAGSNQCYIHDSVPSSCSTLSASACGGQCGSTPNVQPGGSLAGGAF